MKISTRRHIGQHKISLDNHFFYKEQPTSNQEVQIQHGHYQNTLASVQRSNYSRNRQLGEKQVWSNTTPNPAIHTVQAQSGNRPIIDSPTQQPFLTQQILYLNRA